MGTISPEAVNFIKLDFTDNTIFERHLANASINGSIVDLPAGPLGFAVGAEYREDQSDFVPDLAKKNGDILGAACTSARRVHRVFSSCSRRATRASRK